MKIGLIQSRGIGDIIIALPIAKYLADRGNKIYWAINEDFIPSFVNACPYVEFIPLKMDKGAWFYHTPLKILKDIGCEQIIPLYSYLGPNSPTIPAIYAPKKGLSEFLKFDEYKYAAAGVPFREKWNLDIVRDLKREEALFRDVVTDGDYVVTHLQGSELRAIVDLAPIAGGRQIVEITNRTDNVFDWITVIERASLRIMLDSCFSNLTEQLKIPGPKMYIGKPTCSFSPVLLSDWTYLNARLVKL